MGIERVEKRRKTEVFILGNQMSSKAIRKNSDGSNRINNVLDGMDNGYKYLHTHLYQFFVLHIVPKT